MTPGGLPNLGKRKPSYVTQPKPNGEDDQRLAALGYRSELARGMSGFSNYAISFTFICILAGGITSFHVGLGSAGGAAIGLGWPAACLFSLAVAAAMAQIASAFPTAGGLYHWGCLLGNRGLGWATAWFNLAGLITGLAAINAGVYDFSAATLGVARPEAAKTAVILAITLGQALLSQRGVRLTSRLADWSGWWILIVSGVLVTALLVASPRLEWQRLWAFENFTGLPKGAPIFPNRVSLLWAFALGLMLPAYTLTGFDASAHAAEETIDAARNAPAGLLRSVVVSSLFGWALVASLLVAMPDVEEGVRRTSGVTAWVIRSRLPGWLAWTLLGGIVVAQLACGLSALTSGSRMLFAFARDGGLPGSGWLRRVDRRTGGPSVAVWAAAAGAGLFTVAAPYTTIAAVCTVFLYVSYVLPVAAGAWAWGGRWTRMGPWSLGRWYRPLAAVAGVGCVFLIWLGVQPPNAEAAYFLGGSAALMLAVWWGFERRRFRGPPLAPLR